MFTEEVINMGPKKVKKLLEIEDVRVETSIGIEVPCNLSFFPSSNNFLLSEAAK